MKGNKQVPGNRIHPLDTGAIGFPRCGTSARKKIAPNDNDTVRASRGMDDTATTFSILRSKTDEE